MCARHHLRNAIKHEIENRIQNILTKSHHLVGHFQHLALATNDLAQKTKGFGFQKS